MAMIDSSHLDTDELVPGRYRYVINARLNRFVYMKNFCDDNFFITNYEIIGSKTGTKVIRNSELIEWILSELEDISISGHWLKEFTPQYLVCFEFLNKDDAMRFRLACL